MAFTSEKIFDRVPDCFRNAEEESQSVRNKSSAIQTGLKIDLSETRCFGVFNQWIATRQSSDP